MKRYPRVEARKKQKALKKKPPIHGGATCPASGYGPEVRLLGCGV